MLHIMMFPDAKAIVTVTHELSSCRCFGADNPNEDTQIPLPYAKRDFKPRAQDEWRPLICN